MTNFVTSSATVLEVAA